MNVVSVIQCKILRVVGTIAIALIVMGVAMGLGQVRLQSSDPSQYIQALVDQTGKILWRNDIDKAAGVDFE